MTKLTDADLKELRRVHAAPEKETFDKVIKWLRERDLLDPQDYDEGYSADDIIQALDDHEEGCCAPRLAPEAVIRHMAAGKPDLVGRLTAFANITPEPDDGFSRLNPVARSLILEAVAALPNAAIIAAKGDMTIPVLIGGTFKPCEKHPERYCNCEGFYPACRDAPASVASAGQFDKRVNEITRAAIAETEAVIDKAFAERFGATDQTCWLIERKFGTEGRGTTQPLWYAENDREWHWWEPNAADAKRFASKAEAEAFPAYKMIASDPTISITEHVFMAASHDD